MFDKTKTVKQERFGAEGGLTTKVVVVIGD